MNQDGAIGGGHPDPAKSTQLNFLWCGNGWLCLYLSLNWKVSWHEKCVSVNRGWCCEGTGRLKSSPRTLQEQWFSNVSPQQDQQMLLKGQTDGLTPRFLTLWVWGVHFYWCCWGRMNTLTENHCFRSVLVWGLLGGLLWSHEAFETCATTSISPVPKQSPVSGCSFFQLHFILWLVCFLRPLVWNLYQYLRGSYYWYTLLVHWDNPRS